jgi:hypothetical protein
MNTEAVRKACAAALVTLATLGCSTTRTSNGKRVEETGTSTRPIGFEILEMQPGPSIRAWVSRDITREEFEELQLPLGWFKNQIREVEHAGGQFHNSPGMVEGEYRDKDMFGFHWRHVATVTQVRKTVDKGGILNGATVSKSHEIRVDAGQTITGLLSPTGEVYVRITRDADRDTDTSTIPDAWKLISHTTVERLVFRLPSEVLVIRTSNKDSFQGPVQELAELLATGSDPEPGKIQVK